MNRTGYQVVGFVAWNGAKWYLRHRYGRPAKRAGAALLVVAVVGGGAFVWYRTQDS